MSLTKDPTSGVVQFQKETLANIHRRINLDEIDTAIVPCKPLGALMADAGLADGATYLALDVEGAEEVVLHTVFGQGKPSPFAVVMVETHPLQEAKNMNVRRLLRDGGLVQVPLRKSRFSPNELFVRPGLGDPRIAAANLSATIPGHNAFLKPQLAKAGVGPFKPHNDGRAQRLRVGLPKEVSVALNE